MTIKSKKLKILWRAIILIVFNAFLFLIYIFPFMNIEDVTWTVWSQTWYNATWNGVPQQWLETKELIIWETKITVEVAKTQEQRRIGLMFRDHLPLQNGMLFVFEQEQPLSFWMENTYIGLDLLYVWSDQVIKHIHNNAKPLDLSGLPSKVPVQYVIEVNDTFVEQFGIKIWDKILGIR